MPTYKHPGVYVEENPSISRSINRVTTSVASFVGKTARGPVGRAEKIDSFDQYKRIYGDIASENDAMGLAVLLFYLNGGKSAYICRLANETNEPLTANDFTHFYDSILANIQDVNVILLPGEYWPKDGSSNLIINATLAHCDKMKNRIIIIDLPADLELKQATTVNQLALPSSANSVLYYPWLKITNPLYNAEENSTVNKTLVVAPSSFAAGIWSRIDESQGVWKAPAGMNANLIGTTGLKYKVRDSEQDQLNSLGINCIREMPGAGIVVWGARTLASSSGPEWRYIPVRRTAMMIEKSIYEGTQWVVFEPNNQHLWSTLRRTISKFLSTLFRDGALQGIKASDAYFVHCGLDETMTQADIDTGRVIVLVGIALLKPAEFIIIKIQQRVNQQQ